MFRSRWTILLAGTGLLGVTAGLFFTWDFTVDDAFITFRYSRHVAMGVGPVWNLEGARVEGYSNALWMWLLAGAAFLRADLEQAAKILGVVSLGGIAWLIGGAVARWTGSALAASAAVFTLFINPMSWVHAVSGLETAGYALMAVALFVAALEGRPGLLALAGIGAVWLRPDGVVPGVVALAAAMILHPAKRTRVALVGALIGAAGASLLLFRWTFYGAVLPNPYLLKGGDVGSGMSWLLGLSPVLGLALLAAWSVARNAAQLRSHVLTLCFFIVAMTAPFAFAHHVMDYGQRFFFPCTVLLAVLLGLWVARGPPIAARIAPLMILGLTWWGTSQCGTYVRDYPVLHQFYRRVGEALAELPLERAERTLSLGDAGAIPFLCDWQTLDMYGLNSREIAAGGDRSELFHAASPSVAILYSADGNHYDWPAWVAGWNPKHMESRYTPLGKMFMRDYWLQFWVRNDVAEAAKSQLGRTLKPLAVASHATLSKSELGWSDLFRRRLGVRWATDQHSPE